MNLYQIQKEYQELAQAIIDNGGEITPEIETQLAITETSLQEKALNYAYVIKQAQAEQSMIDVEIARLNQLKAAREKLSEQLKERIKGAMEQFGIVKVESPIMNLSFRKSESVEIENEGLLPEIFITTKTVKSPDKTAIKAALKDGKEVPGASLKQNNNLQIK